MDDGENRGIRANSEGEGQERGEGKAGVAAEEAQRVLEVLEHVPEFSGLQEAGKAKTPPTLTDRRGL